MIQILIKLMFGAVLATCGEYQLSRRADFNRDFVQSSLFKRELICAPRDIRV